MPPSRIANYERYCESLSEVENSYLQLSGWGYFGGEVAPKSWFKASKRALCLNCGLAWDSHTDMDDCQQSFSYPAMTTFLLSKDVETFSQENALARQIAKDKALSNFE